MSVSIPSQLATWAAANAAEDSWHGQAARLVLDLACAPIEEAELLEAGLLRWAEYGDRYEPAVAEVAELVWQLGSPSPTGSQLA